jgi:hypothetical protein
LTTAEKIYLRRISQECYELFKSQLKLFRESPNLIHPGSIISPGKEILGRWLWELYGIKLYDIRTGNKAEREEDIFNFHWIRRGANLL